MPLARGQIKRGTQVSIAFDDDGKPLKIKRKGVIVAIDTIKKWGPGGTVAETERNGNPMGGIAKIWVALKDGEPPVEVKSEWLGLIREGRRGDWQKIQDQEALEKSEAVESGEAKLEEGETLTVDQTNLQTPGKPISEAELNRLTTDAH